MLVLLCLVQFMFLQLASWLFSRSRLRGLWCECLEFFEEFPCSSWRAFRGCHGAWTRSSRMWPTRWNFCGSQAHQKWLCCRSRRSIIPNTRGNTIRTSMSMTAARRPCWRLIRKRCSSCAKSRSWACWPGSSLVETKRPLGITAKLQRSFMPNTRRWPSHSTRRSSSGWSAASSWR